MLVWQEHKDVQDPDADTEGKMQFGDLIIKIQID